MYHFEHVCESETEEWKKASPASVQRTFLFWSEKQGRVGYIIAVTAKSKVNKKLPNLPH